MSTNPNFPKVALFKDIYDRRMYRVAELDIDEKYFYLIEKLGLKYEHIKDDLYDEGYKWTINVYYRTNEDLFALCKLLEENVVKYEPSYDDEDYDQCDEDDYKDYNSITDEA